MKKHDLLPFSVTMWCIHDKGRLVTRDDGYPRMFYSQREAKAVCILKGEKPVAVTVRIEKRVKRKVVRRDR